MAVISRHAPASIDAQAVELGRESTVTQLRRVLGKYTFTEPADKPVAEEARRVSFSSTPEGFRLSALLPADDGAVVQKALRELRDELFRPGDLDPAPALVVTTSGPLGGWAQPGGPFRPAPVRGPVMDTYGCGDAFAAGLTFGLARGDSVDDAIGLAARCGAAVLMGRGPYSSQLTEEDL